MCTFIYSKHNDRHRNGWALLRKPSTSHCASPRPVGLVVGTKSFPVSQLKFPYCLCRSLHPLEVLLNCHFAIRRVFLLTTHCTDVDELSYIVLFINFYGHFFIQPSFFTGRFRSGPFFGIRLFCSKWQILEQIKGTSSTQLRATRCLPWT